MLNYFKISFKCFKNQFYFWDLYMLLKNIPSMQSELHFFPLPFRTFNSTRAFMLKSVPL